MTSCAISACRNYKGRLKTTYKVTYHRIPNDPIMRNRWVDIIRKSRGEELWKPAKTTVLCSDHFHPKDMYFSENQIRRRLKKEAIPRKALFLSSVKSDESENSDEDAVLKLELKSLASNEESDNSDVSRDVQPFIFDINTCDHEMNADTSLSSVIANRKITELTKNKTEVSEGFSNYENQIHRRLKDEPLPKEALFLSSIKSEENENCDEDARLKLELKSLESNEESENSDISRDVHPFTFDIKTCDHEVNADASSPSVTANKIPDRKITEPPENKTKALLLLSVKSKENENSDEDVGVKLELKSLTSNEESENSDVSRDVQPFIFDRKTCDHEANADASFPSVTANIIPDRKITEPPENKTEVSEDFSNWENQIHRRLKEKALPREALFLSSVKSEESQISDEAAGLNSELKYSATNEESENSDVSRDVQPFIVDIKTCDHEVNTDASSSVTAYKISERKITQPTENKAKVSEVLSNCDSILDSSTKAKLQKRLRSLIPIEKKNLLEIQSLRRKNLRLKKKIANLEKILEANKRKIS